MAAPASSDGKDIATVFVEQEDGSYTRAWCTYNDLFAADMAAAKSRKHAIDVYTTATLMPKSRMNVDAGIVFRANKDEASGAADMTSLTYLEEPNMLQCLQSRYDADNIYTNIAGVLVAVNPYRNLPNVYTVDNMSKYRAQRRLDLLPPHVFAIAEKAYQELTFRKENQSMICCGESGSGKTESTKWLMRYLANITQLTAVAEHKGTVFDTSLIEKQVLQANPLLEAFGNARTLMNDNSSRFAKFTKLFVSDEEGRIMGAHTETYLLEKSRVVRPSKGERNFHIFYQLAAGGAQQFKLEPAAKFTYLSVGGVTSLANVSDLDNYKTVRESMTVLNMTEEEQNIVLSAIAGIMYIGNVNVVIPKEAAKPALPVPAAGNRSGSVFGGPAAAPVPMLSPDAKQAVARAASLIGVDADRLEKRLTTRRIQIRGKEEFERTLEEDEALYNRDAVSKSLYNALFAWVVRKINAALYRGEVENVNWIGILDVFGFECFEHNSFEQFCINFANERLQEFFNAHILKSEQAEYRKEGIFWTPINIPDSTDCISLVSGKPSGVLCLLDSACIMPKGSAESFFNNLFTVHPNHPRLVAANSKNAPAAKLSANPTRALAAAAKLKEAQATRTGRQAINVSFHVRHYAGYVQYDAGLFLAKNADSTHPDTIELFATSQYELVKGLFAEEAEALKEAQAGNRFQSVGSLFSRQLSSLMETLQATTPYFIRCANPNNTQSARSFMWNYVKPQLRNGGLVEALRMLKFGYPSRVTYDTIFEKYGHSLNPMPQNVNKRNFCEAVLVAFGLGRSQYQLGLTKVFFRPGKQEFLESIFRRSEEPLTPEIEAAIRKWLVKRRNQRACAAIRTFVFWRAQLRRIRAARMFRRAIRLGMIYLQSLKRNLYRMRRLRHARKNAITVIQHFWRHSFLKRRLKKALDTRIRSKRKDRFNMGGMDGKTIEELNVLRVQIQSAKRKEEVERKRFEEMQKEVQAKEALLKKQMEERKLEVDRMQREMEVMRQRDVEAARQTEMVEQLKIKAQKLREENDKAAQTARLIMQQKEAEAKRKTEELERLRVEAIKKQEEYERQQAELKRQKEEDARKREEEMVKVKSLAEKLREEHEAKIKESQRQLAERLEENQRKTDELARIQAQAEKMKQEHVQETAELQQQREAERLRKEQEQARLKAEIDRMRLEVESETISFQTNLRALEEENQRKERALKAMQMEAERLRVEQEQQIAMLQQQREAERLRKEEELRRFQLESEQTQRYLEQQAKDQLRQLADTEAENRRKEEALTKLAADAAEMRRVHEQKAAEAERLLREQESSAAAAAEALRAEKDEAARVYQSRLVELQQESKAELKSEVGRLRTEHEETVKRLQLHILSQDDEIQRLNEEADHERSRHAHEVAQLEAKLQRQVDETRNRDDIITGLRAEIERMRETQVQLNAISERLLAEKDQENKRLKRDHKEVIAAMRAAADKQQELFLKLQRDYDDVVSHFQAELHQLSEDKALHDDAKRIDRHGKRVSRIGTVDGEDGNRLRMHLARDRMNTMVEVRPDFSSLISANITAQKTAKDFVSAFRTKSGWLQKRRPGNLMFGKDSKMRYVILDGGVLTWYKAPPKSIGVDMLGSFDVREYDMIKLKTDEKTNGDVVLHLVPKDKSKSKDEMILELPKPAELKEKNAVADNMMEWYFELNKRIAVMTYMDVVFGADNRAGQKGCRDLLEFICDEKAETLTIENRVADIHSGLMALQEPLRVRKHLFKIALNNVALSDPSVEILANIISENSDIEEIELSYNLITARGAQALANALLKNKSIKSVILDHNSIGDAGLTALANAIPQQRTLYRLSVAANKVSDSGAVALAEALIKCGDGFVFPLLELAENLIGDVGIAALAKLCTKNKSVTKLNVRSNLVTDEGVIKLAEALKSGTSGLIDVRLSSNQITNRGVIAVADALKTCPREVAIDLSHNKLVSRSGVVALVNADFPVEFSLLKITRSKDREKSELQKEVERTQETMRLRAASRVSTEDGPLSPAMRAARVSSVVSR